MFYKTTIKAVTNGGAIDVQGRSLSFIGYLPVKEGDTVFTDGRFIFGNAPPKGAPAIFDVPSGIPVLGDYDSSGEDELRGYFTNRGKYKSFRIAGDEWLVNDDKNFKHDDGSNIIDAEIADGKLYTVEKKVTQIEQDKNLWLWARQGASIKTAPPTKIFESATKDSDCTKRNDSVIRECELIISENAEEKSRLKLSSLMSKIEDELSRYTDFFEVPNHIEEHLLESRATVKNF